MSQLKAKHLSKSILFIGDTEIALGSTVDLSLKISENSSGQAISLPVRVIRGATEGPTLFVCAAVHGDELNGVGIIREFLVGGDFELQSGTLILVPVVNLFGFENLSRYMSDRRDLNRCFPGNKDGSPSSRLASVVFNQIIKKCDFGIDLHTAAGRRTNFPNARGDLSNPAVSRIAKAFGCELLMNNEGPEGSLRREAVDIGCATITIEAGESGKMEPGVLEVGVRGIRNVLIELGMMDGKKIRPLYQVQIDAAKWVRASAGGILQFHIAPGDIVEVGSPIATSTNLFGNEQSCLISPVEGIIMGITTSPTVTPGEPVCFIAVPSEGLNEVKKRRRNASSTSLHVQVREELASSFNVTDPEEDPY